MTAGYQFVEQHDVDQTRDVSDFELQYAVGLDGLSLPLVLLTAFLGLVSILISWRIELRPKEYFAWLLVLETACSACSARSTSCCSSCSGRSSWSRCTSSSRSWGSGNRDYSAMKFVLYTFSGSALMLVGFLVLGFYGGDVRHARACGDRRRSRDAHHPGLDDLPLIIAAFLIKLPVVPLHTWLPDAHTDAPTAVSVILAGVLLKMGGYGMLRMSFSIMPDSRGGRVVWLAIIAAVSILYGAVMTLRQTGPEAADRVLQRQPHGLRAARRIGARRWSG